MKNIKEICGFKIKKEKIGNITVINMTKWIGFEHKMYIVFIYTDGDTLGYTHTDTPIKSDHMHYCETMSKKMSDCVIKLAEK